MSFLIFQGLASTLVVPAVYLLLGEHLADIRNVFLWQCLAGIVSFFVASKLIGSMKLYLLKRGKCLILLAKKHIYCGISLF